MDAIFPIHRNFTELIFSGEKDIEFRNKKTKLEPGDRVYIYETKKNGGRGMVVGYFTYGKISEIAHSRIGTYNMLLNYVKKYGNKEEQEAVERAMKINLNNHDNCLVLYYIFDRIAIEYMERTHEPLDETKFFEKADGHAVKMYRENRSRANKLVQNCDKWLKRIGYYDEYEESYWKYQIEIKEPHEFDQPVPITNFRLMDGRQITKAPQSFCYTIGQEG